MIRWWMSRHEIDDLVWSHIPHEGAFAVDLAKTTGLRLARVRRSLHRMEDARPPRVKRLHFPETTTAWTWMRLLPEDGDR